MAIQTKYNIADDLLPLAVPIELMDMLPGNPNKGDVLAIARSYEEFGQLKPVVGRAMPNGRWELSAGNHSYLAAKDELEWTHLALVRTDHDEVRAQAFAIADNHTGRMGEDDKGALLSMMENIYANDAALLAAASYGEGDIQLLRAQAAAAEDTTRGDGGDGNQATLMPEHPIPVKGDIWQLGSHRIMCGDCRSADDVTALLDGATINLAVTSPPYAEQRKYDEASEFTPVPPDNYVEWFAPVSANVADHLAEDGSWLVNIKPSALGLDTHPYVLDLVLAHAREWGWHWATEFCWERTGVPGEPRSRLKNQFEPVYQFARGKWKFIPENVRHLTDNPIQKLGKGGGNTSWATRQGGNREFFEPHQMTGEPGWAYPGNRLPSMMSTHEATGHTAAYPVGLPQFFALLFTDPGDVVYDPFVGSGSSILAAHNSTRVGYGMEVSPKYVHVACARYQRHTDEKPINLATGEPVSFLE